MMSLASAMPARHTMMPVTAMMPGLPISSVAVTVVPMTMAPMPVETGHHSVRAPVTAPTVVAPPVLAMSVLALLMLVMSVVLAVNMMSERGLMSSPAVGSGPP